MTRSSTDIPFPIGNSTVIYMTVVMDLKSGAVVFDGDGMGADALKPFWKRLRPSKAVIEAVAMDKSAA